MIEENPYDEKSIFLRKDNTIVGLYSIGEDNKDYEVKHLDGSITQCHGFLATESWGNYYDEEYNMLGKGSFRVFSDIEEVAQDFECEGWIRFERIVQ